MEHGSIVMSCSGAGASLSTGTAVQAKASCMTAAYLNNLW